MFVNLFGVVVVFVVVVVFFFLGGGDIFYLYSKFISFSKMFPFYPRVPHSMPELLDEKLNLKSVTILCLNNQYFANHLNLLKCYR